VALDLALPPDGGDDALAGWIDSGRLLVAGSVPTSGPVPTPATVAAGIRALLHRLGFGGADPLRRVVVSPACGLAGLDPAAARTVMATVSAAAVRLAEDPDGEESDR
jgi:methionine synthase II (cobalamin-independent)